MDISHTNPLYYIELMQMDAFVFTKNESEPKTVFYKL